MHFNHALCRNTTQNIRFVELQAPSLWKEIFTDIEARFKVNLDKSQSQDSN